MEVGVRSLGKTVRTRAPLSGKLCSYVAPRILETIGVAAAGLRLATVVPVDVDGGILSDVTVPVAQLTMGSAAGTPTTSVTADGNVQSDTAWSDLTE